MRIDARLIPSSSHLQDLASQSVVVIDVLRATSVMVQALSSGVKEIIPVTTVEEAFQIAKSFPSETRLLGGERESRKVAGFDLGNSPREYITARVKGKTLVLTTTNGTKAFHAVSSGKTVWVGSFLNASAVAQRCLNQETDVLLYASGDEGRVSLEDAVCGGMIIDRLIHLGKPPIELTDASQMALISYQRFQRDLMEALRLSNHGRALLELGLGEDLPFCAQTDTTVLVPIFKDGVVRI
jgi:2-phosphosulfolactate phosphatase